MAFACAGDGEGGLAVTGLTAPSTVALIDFAAAHPGPHSGNVETLIRRDLGITPARYFQLLGRAIRTIEALEHDPVTVGRLLRQADALARIRSARTGAGGY